MFAIRCRTAPYNLPVLAGALMLATGVQADSSPDGAVLAFCLDASTLAAQPDGLLSACPDRQVAAAQSADPDQAPATPGRYLRQDSERTRNVSAADLQPSWSGLNALATKTGFAEVTAEAAAARKNTLLRLRTAHTGTEGAKTALHDIPASSIVVAGERNGIAYGAWKSGPAGTLPVRHYTGAHDIESRSDVSKDFKAALRRSAKIWSKRLVDDGRRSRVTLLDGKVVRKVHGIVIQTRLHNDNGAASARVLKYDRGKDRKGYRVYNGRIRIPITLHDNLHDGMVQTVAHEIGHILGVARKGTELFKKYYDPESHTWRGPNAMRANDGKPVPMQWVSRTNWTRFMEPHAEGARRDTAHIGLCASLMAYCRDDYDGSVPGEIDFAFLADIGYTVIDAETAAETERYGHLSWGEWAVWGASVGRDLKDNRHETPHDFVEAHAEAFGTAPAIPLSGNDALTGTVEWNGSLVGVDLGRDRLPPVVGKAQLSVDLATLAGTARFSGLTVHVDGNNVLRRGGTTKPFRQSELSYAVAVADNDFADADGRVSGSFHGPAHQEMAGVLRDDREEVNLLAGFGGARTGE